MNRKELEQILKEELEEGFFSNVAAKLRGAKDGGWEAVAAQGDDEDASSEMAGAPSDAKIPVKELIGKLAAAGLPPDVSQQLFDEIVKQLKDIHGYGDAAIKEQAGALRGVAAQQSARTTSNMPSRKKTLDLDAVKIPKNMRKQVEQVLSDFFSKHGFTSVSLGQGAAHEPPGKAAVEPDRASEEEEEAPNRVDLLKPPRSTRDIKGSKNYKKFMASLLDFFANQMKIDIKIAKKIVRDIWAKTPASGNFNKLIFKEAMEREIDIATILADSGLNPAQQIKVLGALKKWAVQNSDLIDNRMTKILRLQDKEGEKKELPPPPETNAGAPVANTQDRTRLDLIKTLIHAKTKKDFKEAYNKLLKSKFGEGKDEDTIELATFRRDPMMISAFGGDDDTREALRQKFKDLFLSDEVEKRPPTAKKPSSEKKPGKNNKPYDPVLGLEGIDRKDQVIIERWQRISGINKKET